MKALEPGRVLEALGVATPAAIPSLDDVFRQYARYVAAIALKFLGKRDEADDVVQDVFLAAARHLHQLRDGRAIKGWLATTTVRAARRKLRRRSLRRSLGLEDEPRYEEAIAPDASPEQRAVLASIYKKLGQLSSRQRIAWVLRYVEGHPLEEVATYCECSLATAKRDIAAAAHALREHLHDR